MKFGNLSKYREFLLIFTFSSVIVCGMMLLWITPNSGYHPVDDHEFLMWTYLIRHEGRSLFDLIREYNISNIYSGRFRPLYLIMRGLFIGLFGADIRLYYIWAVIKTVIAFILLYYMFRNMGTDIIRSMVAVAVSMIGYQSCVWWKLGTHETVTLAWFALGMILMIRYLLTDNKIFSLFSVLSFLIMSLYKETFIVLLPFVVLYAVYFDTIKLDGNSFISLRSGSEVHFSCPVKTITEVLKKHPIYYFLLLTVFAIEITVILTLIGQDYLGEQYDGLAPIINGFTSDMKWLVFFGITMSIIIISHDRETIKIWPCAILYLAFILPQFYMFRATGIIERYLIPFAVGFAIFYVAEVPQRMNIGRIRKYIYYSSVILLILASARAMLIEGSYYKYRGLSTTKLMDTISELSASDHSLKVLSCLYYEVSDTIYANNLLSGSDNVYHLVPDWDTFTYEITPVTYYHYIHFASSQPAISGLEDMDLIVMYNQEDRHWGYHAYEFLELAPDDYNISKCGTFTIYARKDSGVDLSENIL